MTLHFPPTDLSRQNLLDEQVEESWLTVTGNTVIDALHLETAKQRSPGIQKEIDQHLGALLGPSWRSTPFVLITGHRHENFGEGFQQICVALQQLARQFADHQFIYPVHLNPNVQGPVGEALGDEKNIRLIPPQGYRHFVALMEACQVVLTDSGGVREEAPGLGKPVLVMRDTTERPEGIDAGTVQLIGTDTKKIVDQVGRLLTDADAYRQMSEAVNLYGDGKVAERIVDAVKRYLAT